MPNSNFGGLVPRISAYARIWGNRWVLKEFQRFDLANDRWTTLTCGLSVPDWTRPSPEGSVSITQYDYNLRGELITETDPLGRETGYTYDGNGNMVTKTFPNGRTNTYHTDALNRLTAIDYPDGSHDYFAYDAVGNLTEANGVDATLLYTYDLLSRITDATQVYDDREEVITYQYNGDNLRTMMVWGDKSWVTQYDANHRTQHLTNPYGETTSFTYATCCTAVQDVIHANGARIHYDYDQAERITDVLNLKPDQTILKSFHYDRDANGMVTSVDREDPYWNQAYLYDNRLQLQGASYGYPSWMNELYFYDGRGNRLEKWVDSQVAETYTYNAADEIQSRQFQSGLYEEYGYEYQDSDDYLLLFQKRYPYDPPIYVRRAEHQKFDYREKMVAFSRTSGVFNNFTDTLEATYAYLPDGLGRVGKKALHRRQLLTNGQMVRVTDTETFVLNDFYNMLDEEITTTVTVNNVPQSTDFTQKVYTMGPDIDFPLAMRHNNDSYLYYLNGHGDVSSFVSMDGSYEEPYEYGVWGEIQTQNSIINNILYTSREYDMDTTLQFNRNRYYIPIIGRFSSLDPLFNFNAYVYAENMPTNAIDPLGLAIWHCLVSWRQQSCSGLGKKADCAACCANNYVNAKAACSCPFIRGGCMLVAAKTLSDCMIGCGSLL